MKLGYLADAELDEKTWSRLVHQLAEQLGFKRYHTYRSKNSQPGWPDEALLRERLLFLEIKTETGKVSEKQREWIVAMLKADVEIYVVRPRHLDEIGRVLSQRKRPAWVEIPLLAAELDTIRSI